MIADIPIVVPTHKRAGKVTTHKLIKDVILCVAESQVEEYKYYYNDLEIIAHPDEIIGLSPKRQWIYEKFGDVFMVDDDLYLVLRVYLGSGSGDKYYLKPDEAYNLIQDVYRIVKELDIYLFGFNRSPHPLAYIGNTPIEMNSFIPAGAFGIIKSPYLYFPNDPYFVAEDYFINGLNAFYHRKSYADTRFCFAFKDTETNVGGCSDYRTDERRKNSYFQLKKYFGDAIVRKRATSLKKHLSSKWEKTLKIPY